MQCPGEELIVVEPPPAPQARSNAAGWFFAAVLLAVIVYEVWAVKTGHPTISQWIRRKFSKLKWWRPFSIGLIALILWHLFEGGPL